MKIEKVKDALNTLEHIKHPNIITYCYDKRYCGSCKIDEDNEGYIKHTKDCMRIEKEAFKLIEGLIIGGYK